MTSPGLRIQLTRGRLAHNSRIGYAISTNTSQSSQCRQFHHSPSYSLAWETSAKIDHDSCLILPTAGRICSNQYQTLQSLKYRCRLLTSLNGFTAEDQVSVLHASKYRTRRYSPSNRYLYSNAAGICAAHPLLKNKHFEIILLVPNTST